MVWLAKPKCTSVKVTSISTIPFGDACKKMKTAAAGAARGGHAAANGGYWQSSRFASEPEAVALD
jgi:hypothetical protein